MSQLKIKAYNLTHNRRTSWKIHHEDNVNDISTFEFPQMSCTTIAVVTAIIIPDIWKNNLSRIIIVDGFNDFK